MPTEYETTLMTGLDAIAPDWFIQYATRQDLVDFAHAVIGTGAERRAERGPVAKLRRGVVDRMHTPVRAAIEAGLVKPA
jgi:hypothetical protein